MILETGGWEIFLLNIQKMSCKIKNFDVQERHRNEDKMDEKRTISEEIEESIRICEELLNENPGFIPERPDFDFEDIIKNEDETDEESKQLEEPVSEANTEIKQEEQQTKSKKSGTRNIRRTLISILVCVVIAVAVSILITKFVANRTTVEGGSMEPCLKDGDELIVEKLSYFNGEPERFDVIVFEYSKDVKYIKRIIGLPGETVRIEEGKIYINDRPVFDVHGKGDMTDAGIAENNIALGSDEYFVLGDNRDASKDSRDEDVGLVKADQIVGKAWLRIMPFDSFGIIE